MLFMCLYEHRNIGRFQICIIVPLMNNWNSIIKKGKEIFAGVQANNWHNKRYNSKTEEQTFFGRVEK